MIDYRALLEEARRGGTGAIDYTRGYVDDSGRFVGDGSVVLSDGSTGMLMPDGSLVLTGQYNGDQLADQIVVNPDGSVGNTTYGVPGANDVGRQLAMIAGVTAPFLVPTALGMAAPGAAAAGAVGAGAPEAAALAAAENGILGSTVGAGAGAGAAAAGAPALGGNASGFVGEGTRSGVPQWDRAPGSGAIAPSLFSGLGNAASGMFSNPALLAALAGGVAGIAGNSDITSSQNSTSNTTDSGAASGSVTGNATTAQSQGLAPWLQGYAQDFVDRSRALANAPSSNAPMDTARELMTRYATGGDPLVNAARAQQGNVIGGGMLGGNPYLDSVARGIGDRMGDAYAVGTRANTATRFNNDGNSPAAKSAYGQTQFVNDRAFADSLGQTMNNLYFNNYQGERQAQDAASRSSLGFGQFGVQNAGTLYGIGAQDFQRPFMQNQQFGAAINPAFGSQSTGQSNTAQNSLQNVLNNRNTQGTQQSVMQAPNNVLAGTGGALSALSIYNMLYPRR